MPPTPSISSRTARQLVELVRPWLPGGRATHTFGRRSPRTPEGAQACTPLPATHRPPGLIDGVGVDMHALRPAVIKAQAAMRAGYEQAAPCTCTCKCMLHAWYTCMMLAYACAQHMHGTCMGYGQAFEAVRSKPGAAEVLDRIAALPEKRGKARQMWTSDIVGLYKGALVAVDELWHFGRQASAASGEAGVKASWGIKKVPRPSCAEPRPDLRPQTQIQP